MADIVVVIDLSCHADSVNELVNPTTIAAPAANYSHAVVSSASSRLMHTSGVVPTRADGTVPDTVGEQAAVVWATIDQILAAGGFELGDIVSVTTYVVAGNELGEVMAARDRALAGHRAASTLVVVPQLARPQWQMEIAVVAATDRPATA